MLGGRWVRASTITLPFGAFSDYVAGGWFVIMNRDCWRLSCQYVLWLYLSVPLEWVHCRPRRQIVQRPKLIGSSLGACLINSSGSKYFHSSYDKYISTLYRSPNSNNNELLFDHLSKSIETITIHSPSSEIIVLGDLNVHNSDWLTYSSNVTNPAGRDAEAIAIVNNFTQVISEPTSIPDRAGDITNTFDLFLTSILALTLLPSLALLLVTLIIVS